MRRIFSPRNFLCLLALTWALPAMAQEAPPRDSLRVIEMSSAREGEKPPVVTALTLQPQGNLLATAGDDHVVRVWDIGSTELITQLEAHDDWVRTATFSPDGRHLATAGNDKKIFLWDASDFSQHRVLAEHTQAVIALAYRPDGDMLAAVGFEGNLRMYDPVSGELLFTFNCPCVDMRCIAFSPDGRYLVGGGRNGRIRIWDVESGEAIHSINAHEQRIRAVCFTGEGNRFVSAGEDRRLLGWDAATGDSWLEIPTGSTKVMCMTCCSQDCVAVGGSDNAIRICDLNTGAMIERITGHMGSIAAMTADRDLLISGSYDTSVRIWLNPLANNDQAAELRLESAR